MFPACHCFSYPSCKPDLLPLWPLPLNNSTTIQLPYITSPHSLLLQLHFFPPPTMEKASIEIDLDEWELLSDDNPTFVDLDLKSGKELFSNELPINSGELIDMNYFICPNQQGPYPITQKQEVEKNLDDEVAHEFKDVGVVAPPPVMFVDREVVSQVLFKLKDDDHELFDMKMDSPKSNNAVIRLEEEEKEEFLKNSAMEEEKVERKLKPCCEGIGLSIWRWRLNGIGALCSIGVAAATICILVIGGRQQPKQQHQNQRLQFHIYTNDKRIRQMMQQATRQNQALSAVRTVPTRRADISFGGYYDGL